MYTNIKLAGLIWHDTAYAGNRDSGLDTADYQALPLPYPPPPSRYAN